MSDHDKLRTRRAKLLALATRGVDGERETAQRMLDAFDKKHPEVKSAKAQPLKSIIIINGVAVDMEELTRVLAYYFPGGFHFYR